jgi:hypothetical protein
MDVIKTEGTPDGQPGNPFNQTTVIITTADKGIDQRIRAAAQSAGMELLRRTFLEILMQNIFMSIRSPGTVVAIRIALRFPMVWEATA